MNVLIEGKEDFMVAFATKDVELVIEWDDDKKVGGIFKKEYVDGKQRSYTLTKLANVFDRSCAEELGEIIKHIISKAVEQQEIRNNY